MTTIVARYDDPIEAQIACGLLQAEGIEVHVGDAHTALANWEWRLAIGGVKLHVPDDQLERARGILQRLEAGDYALPDDATAAAADATTAPGRPRWWAWLGYLALVLLAVLGVNVIGR
ncbi:DUF2007 domain-containing protein [Luteimonas terrae]|nr:DUF2007 domain-containing protein [Luteimonas terrae]